MSRKKLKVYIEGDAKSAEKALDDTSKKAEKLKHVMGTAFKVGAAAAGAALVAFGALVKKTADDLARIERISAQTDAALASTGGVANVSREEIEGLADSLEKLTSIEAEQIQEGQNLLLTFTNLKNGVGEGNDIFNQATATMVDMSVALKQDLSQTAVQVGKALNDPIQGVTALRRVGVQLSEQQQQQIADFMAVNDIMGAQKVILGELQTQFGGSGEALGKTLSGQIAILKHYGGEFMETVVAPIMPAIGSVVSGLTDMFKNIDPSLLEGAFKAIGDTLVGFLPMLQTGFQVFFELMAQVAPILTEIIGRAGDIIMRIVDSLMSSGLIDVLLEIGEIIAVAIMDVIEALVPVVEALAPVVTRILQFVADVLRRIAPILGEIATKVADILTRILEKIEPYLDTIFDAVMKIVDAVLPILPALLDLLTPLLNIILDLIPPVATLVGWLSEIAAMIVGALGQAIEWIIGVISGFGDIWSIVWNGVKGVFEGVWNGIVWFKDTIIMPVVEVLKGLWDGLTAVWSSVWSGLKGIVKGAVLGILNVLKPMAYALDVLNIFSGEATFEGPIIRAIEAVQAWHQGGPIAPGLGEVLLPLGLFKGDEWIIRGEAVNALGQDNMALLNRGVLPSKGGGTSINVYVENLYGNREYVRLLAKEIKREMPAIEFGAWSRV